MSSNEIIKDGKEYVGYDYKTVTTNREKTSFYLDAYENLGWLPNDALPMIQQGSLVTLNLKRERKIVGKAELTRLQQHFEACVDAIAALEASKIRKATIYSLAAGLLGTVFMAGAVFAVTSVPPLILLCVLLGIPALAGWALAYPLFRLIRKKRAAEIMPLIEQKYEEIHDICAKGNALVHK